MLHRPAEDVDEQQQEGDRRETGHNNRIQAVGDVALGLTGENGGAMQEVHSHDYSLLSTLCFLADAAAPSVPEVADGAFTAIADECEKDVFETRLLLDVFDRGGRQ